MIPASTVESSLRKKRRIEWRRTDLDWNNKTYPTSFRILSVVILVLNMNSIVRIICRRTAAISSTVSAFNPLQQYDRMQKQRVGLFSGNSNTGIFQSRRIRKRKANNDCLQNHRKLALSLLSSSAAAAALSAAEQLLRSKNTLCRRALTTMVIFALQI